MREVHNDPRIKPETFERRACGIPGRDCPGFYEEGELRCSVCKRFRGSWVNYPWSTEEVKLGKNFFARIWRPLDKRFPIRVTLHYPPGVHPYVTMISLKGVERLRARYERLKARRKAEKAGT